MPSRAVLYNSDSGLMFYVGDIFIVVQFQFQYQLPFLKVNKFYITEHRFVGHYGAHIIISNEQ